MPVKLVLTRVEEPDSPDEYVFDRTPIIIGRAGSSHLTIPDFKRIVSKEHARIEEEGGAYTVTDLGSKNYTFLNERRLESGRAYPIKDGDHIALGEFKIEFKTLAPAEPDYDKTVFDLSFGNPFDDAAEQLAEVLESIRQRFDEEEPRRRGEALREALSSALPDAAQHEAEQVIAELLAPNGKAASSPPPSRSEASPPATPPREHSTAPPPKTSSDPSRDVVRQHPSGISSSPSREESAPAPTAPTSRLQRFALAVLEATAKLVGTPWQFRHEFIGQTIMQSADAAFLYEGDAAKLQQMLLSDDIDDETFKERLQLLREALDDLAVHQVALLDGYKASVQGGAQRLLDALDPNAMSEEMDLDNPLFKLMPAKAKAEVLEQLEERARDIRAEDWSVTERRVYRPAFVKAYLARMTSVRR